MPARPARDPSTREARPDAPGTLYHGILRGLTWETLVADDEDRASVVARLRTIATATGTRMRAWVLL